MLTYKGYTGIPEYDSDDKIFTGEVIDLNSVITFQGRSVEEMEQSFKESVDLYLARCEEDGVPPEKPYSGKFNVRIPPDLHRSIAIEAAKRHESLNDWVIETFRVSIIS